jgi:hypothetical protein
MIENTEGAASRIAPTPKAEANAIENRAIRLPMIVDNAPRPRFDSVLTTTNKTFGPGDIDAARMTVENRNQLLRSIKVYPIW